MSVPVTVVVKVEKFGPPNRYLKEIVGVNVIAGSSLVTL